LALYSPVFLIGLIGNVLILLTVFTDKHIRKAKNFYLINLAVCDLCVTLVCMPMSVGTIVYRLWVYGTVVAGSIFTLTAMSIDRYISIQHPLTANWVTSPNKALLIIAFTWLVSGIFMGPI
ncbi:galanin receptor 2a-like, partial [Patella vulgata]|uniref:galanin receptor 2a-like n=1 Tax=Patella vulgata TaxID=6465 RepID=UPI0024A8D6B6